MRRSLLAGVTVLVLAACSGGGGPVDTQVDSRVAKLARLNAAVAAVADAQAAADPRLADHLEALRRLDALIEELRDPEQVDAAKGRWGQVEERLADVDPDRLQEAYRELAFAVDDARSVLVRAREDLSDGWEEDYLDAQDDVLTAVRTYAEAADALAQVIGRYWDDYEQVTEATRTFVEQRWFYRTSQEAADAYELAIDDHLPRLVEARELVAEFTVNRGEAAVAVNQATAEAAAVWASRPAPSARPGT